MVIEKIISRGTETAEIVFSGGEKFRVSKILIYEKALRKGDEIDEELFGTLALLNRKNQIKNRALNLLARRPHGREELKRKLLQKKMEKEYIDEVLQSLQDSGLLNDKEYSILYYNDKLNRGRESKRKILYDLRKKGIAVSVIDEISGMFPEDEENLDEIKKIAEKKLRSHTMMKKTKIELKHNLFQFLLSKGYDYEVIKIVVEELTGATED